MPQPFIPAVNTAQVSMIYDVLGQTCENVYNFVGTAPWTPTTLNNLGAAMLGWEDANGKDVRSTSTALERVTVRDLSAQDAAIVEVLGDLPIDGLNTNKPLPNNVTIAIKHITGFAGRSFRGRTFWLSLCDNMTVLNQLTGPFQTSLVARMNEILVRPDLPNGAKLCVLSRRHSNAWRTTAVTTPVIGFSINPNLDSQRRRLPDHNRHR